MIAKDGYKIILYTGLILLLFLIFAFVTESLFLNIVSGIVCVIFIFHFFFFRDPQREIPQGDNLILSPADGRIIKVDEIEDPLYFKEKVQRVAIFMSIFNVHINRIPVSGKVDFVDYKKGQYLAAFADKAFDCNEQAVIGINGSKGKVFFKQIAGLIARRIVCRAKENQQVQAGARFGMIIYSSRVDVFLPLSAKVHVKLKDKVKGGLSIIGEF